MAQLVVSLWRPQPYRAWQASANCLAKIAKYTCDLPVCADASVCQSTTTKRSEEWNGNNNPPSKVSKEHDEEATTKRSVEWNGNNWGTPPSSDSTDWNGNEWGTPPSSESAEQNDGSTTKRSDPHHHVRPCKSTPNLPPPLQPSNRNLTPTSIGPQICDARGRCGCDFEAAHGPVKRALETSRIHRPCPLICNAKHRCACKRPDGPNIYNATVTAVTAVTATTSTTAIPHRPCPLICDQHGHCGCDSSPGNTAVSGAPVVTATGGPIPIHGPFAPPLA